MSEERLFTKTGCKKQRYCTSGLLVPASAFGAASSRLCSASPDQSQVSSWPKTSSKKTTIDLCARRSRSPKLRRLRSKKRSGPRHLPKCCGRADLTDVEIDAEGNVIGVRKGTGTGPLIAIAAHLDTVFPEGTNVKVRREGTRLYAPGVGDDSRALAVLLR